MPFDGTHIPLAAAHLLRAKEYLIDNGWCSSGPHDDTGRVCISSAIAFTGDREVPGVKAGYLMGKALGVEPSWIDGYTIGRWNDTPGRTIDEVLDGFDRAIAIALGDPS